MQTTTSPVAYLCTGRNRQKIHGDNLVYLEDGQEFSIELYNPTSQNVAAKIYINDNSISSTMIVIKPAQRYYLDRFIDTPKKFKFSTYTAEGEESTVKKAIQSNGLVKVEFFNELTYTPYTNYPYFSGTVNPYNTGTVNPYNTINTNFTGIGMNPVLPLTNFTHTSQSTGPTGPTRSRGITGSLRSLEVETGRVEQGSNSNQSFGSYSGNFSTWPTSTSQYKILPVSQKPIETGEIHQFCVSCGTKRKKTAWQFCPSCGAKY